MAIKMNPAQLDLTGRTVLVTGASSGLGARFATVLAGSGANVVLAARRIDKLQQLRVELERGGARALAVEMDVSDESSTRRAYDAAEESFGVVDTVVANAGMNVEGPVLDIEAAQLDALFAVNVRGAFLTVREGARRLFAAPVGRKDGRVIIISSITASAISPGLALYSASKAAVLQLGRVLAREWANRGINVNVLCPGYIETDINSDWFQTDGGKRQIQRWPRKRLMDNSSLDSILLYLASDASSHVTGSVFNVDDGQTL